MLSLFTTFIAYNLLVSQKAEILYQSLRIPLINTIAFLLSTNKTYVLFYFITYWLFFQALLTKIIKNFCLPLCSSINNTSACFHQWNNRCSIRNNNHTIALRNFFNDAKSSSNSSSVSSKYGNPNLPYNVIKSILWRPSISGYLCFLIIQHCIWYNCFRHINFYLYHCHNNQFLSL